MGIKKPDWLKVKYDISEVKSLEKILNAYDINTVCKEANCPNIGQCFKSGTATFIIMGEKCTRNCKFCNVKTGTPEPLDVNEPLNIAKSVKALKLDYVVITQVTRDDLKYGGAEHMAETIRAVRELNPNTSIEILISDLAGDIKGLKIILAEEPDVLNHNIEMVKSLYNEIRPGAEYERSLKILKYAKEISPNIITKTGFMLGIGETEEEIKELLLDLKAVDVDILTISQYLQPSENHYKLKGYISLEDFKKYKSWAKELGIKYVIAEPLVRSSYKAKEAYKAVVK